jgi:hypothetical protein
MRVVSYQRAVRILQPVIVPVIDALQYGLDEAAVEHARRGFERGTDPWYFLHSARRSAFERLSALGLAQTVDDGDRSLLNLSGLLVHHGGLVVRVLRPDADGPVGGPPPPPATGALQAFYRQQPLPGLEGTDNLVLTWKDSDGVVDDPLTLARPVGGDSRRDSLRLSWDGPLSRDMARLRAPDLDELRPEHQWETLGGEAG